MKVKPVNIDILDLWFEINTFQCSYGRLTPEMCEKLRQRPSIKEYVSGNRKNLKVPFKPACCEKCNEWKKLAEEVYKKRKEFLEKQTIQNQQKGGVRMVEKGIEKGIEKGKSDKKKENIQVVSVDFAPAPELLEILKKKAEEELRPLNYQILWEIKKSLKNDGVLQ